MSNVQENNKKSVSWIKIILGIVIIAGGALFYFYTRSFMQTAVPVDATIIDIVYITDSDGDSHTSARVKYDVDGVEYEQNIGYNWGMKAGKALKVYYDPDNPLDARYTADNWILYAGIVMMAAALVYVGIRPAFQGKKV